MVPGLLEKTDSGGATFSVEVEGSTGLPLEEEDESVVVVVLSLASIEAVWSRPADFLGEAKRQSGRMCSMLQIIKTSLLGGRTYKFIFKMCKIQDKHKNCERK